MFLVSRGAAVSSFCYESREDVLACLLFFFCEWNQAFAYSVAEKHGMEMDGDGLRAAYLEDGARGRESGVVA